MSSVTAVESVMSCSVRGGWTDARVFHGNLIALPCQEIATAWQNPKGHRAWRQELLWQTLAALGYVIDPPKYAAVGSASDRPLIPHIHQGWSVWPWAGYEYLWTSVFSFGKIISMYILLCNIYLYIKYISIMYNACYAVQYATDVSTLPQSYNCTIRFIKLKYISEVHRNHHVLPLEAPAHISLPPALCPSCISCARLEFCSWTDEHLLTYQWLPPASPQPHFTSSPVRS